ncbi:hypothetical protein CYMTET_15046 [Cymbomonas tetramitiformis]|uniref:Uncharacterized protein n=1 Tax=Cymbomonas tetramitiformis TaxID=36881 RepID=A0AAE0GEU7_9CHLO|nr:hypothetical protein CYMTET_15046 [Cymbomonas tetramitiformis]
MGDGGRAFDNGQRPEGVRGGEGRRSRYIKFWGELEQPSTDTWGFRLLPQINFGASNILVDRAPAQSSDVMVKHHFMIRRLGARRKKRVLVGRGPVEGVCKSDGWEPGGRSGCWLAQGSWRERKRRKRVPTVEHMLEQALKHEPTTEQFITTHILWNDVVRAVASNPNFMDVLEGFKRIGGVYTDFLPVSVTWEPPFQMYVSKPRRQMIDYVAEELRIWGMAISGVPSWWRPNLLDLMSSAMKDRPADEIVVDVGSSFGLASLTSAASSRAALSILPQEMHYPAFIRSMHINGPGFQKLAYAVPFATGEVCGKQSPLPVAQLVSAIISTGNPTAEAQSAGGQAAAAERNVGSAEHGASTAEHDEEYQEAGHHPDDKDSVKLEEPVQLISPMRRILSDQPGACIMGLLNQLPKRYKVGAVYLNGMNEETRHLQFDMMDWVLRAQPAVVALQWHFKMGKGAWISDMMSVGYNEMYYAGRLCHGEHSPSQVRAWDDEFFSFGGLNEQIRWCRFSKMGAHGTARFATIQSSGVHMIFFRDKIL